MNKIAFLLAFLTLTACKQTQQVASSETKPEPFTMVFASCNDQDREQPLWKPIINTQPDVFIWGGDNVYSDTDDMEKMAADYDKVWANTGYQELVKNTPIIGTWDDHDYGKNDAGKEWHKKEEAQQVFLDFLQLPKNDPRRKREGVYHAQTFTTDAGSVKVILLDTRYFRGPLKENPNPENNYERYIPWEEGRGGSILGAEQWKWLARQLQDDTPNFTVIVSSIQFLSNQHGFEKWANHPSEVKKMYKTLQNTKANNILILSGDRHHAEVSVNKTAGLDAPLVDFTSSGLTHTWPGTPMDINPYRIGEGTKQLNFGVLYFDFAQERVTFEIRGKNNELLEQYTQQY
ncbi:alkaline phosphatase D family protein [Marixanthomonas spongiae]|uniref:Alkaline phosphatase n=1 Tax=Marixanthomonas spongiae TaxID=2174845 RepID=A0A2U0HXQ2_9FLAO|nr:alkaline phosphatase D family protein [Marixanthomonas spongiae]PVW13520.1 alkaline phosphatase [Marixanthomonas spongiae]